MPIPHSRSFTLTTSFFGDDDEEKKYAFVIKDELSGYAWISACFEATVEHDARTARLMAKNVHST